MPRITNRDGFVLFDSLKQKAFRINNRLFEHLGVFLHLQMDLFTAMINFNNKPGIFRVGKNLYFPHFLK